MRRSKAAPRAPRAAAALLLLGTLAGLAAGCSHAAAPASQLVEIGPHRARLVSPRGWEHLDHGRAQLFRNGETELRLEDLGPATPRALADQVRAARSVWLAGRRRDAIASMRRLGGPSLAFLPWARRADFWRPWGDATYATDAADSATLGTAFDAMIDGAEALPALTTDQLVEYVLERSDDAARREIDRRDSLAVHGTTWLAIETWSRTSHLDRRRVAFALPGGSLLELSAERGGIERTGGAFDSLLTSIEVLRSR